jgi:hypothetical protein
MIFPWRLPYGSHALTPRSTVILEKLTLAQLVNKSNEGSLPRSHGTGIQSSKLVTFRNDFYPEDGNRRYLSAKLQSISFQNTVIFIVNAVRTSQFLQRGSVDDAQASTSVAPCRLSAYVCARWIYTGLWLRCVHKLTHILDIFNRLVSVKERWRFGTTCVIRYSMTPALLGALDWNSVYPGTEISCV